MSSSTMDFIQELESGPLYAFRDWKDGGSLNIPSAAAGVYTIWRGDEFIYAGMSGRSMTSVSIAQARATGKRRGLMTRLASHASGRRSGDQFCVYVADTLVLPTLSADTIAAIANGGVDFDELIRTFILESLSYRFVIVEDSASAFKLEAQARRGLPSGLKPLLNPL